MKFQLRKYFTAQSNLEENNRSKLYSDRSAINHQKLVVISKANALKNKVSIFLTK